MESPRYNHARNATDFATAWIHLRLLLPCEIGRNGEGRTLTDTRNELVQHQYCLRSN